MSTPAATPLRTERNELLRRTALPAGRFDVAVIGAGVVGASTARALAATCARVLLLDGAAEPGRGSRAAVGVGVPSVRLLDDPSMLEFARHGHRVLTTDLAELSGIGAPLASAPGLLRPLARHADAERLTDRAAAHPGLLGEWVTADQLADLEPTLARKNIAGAFFDPGAQVIDAPGYVGALVAAAEADGALVALGTQVMSIAAGQGGVRLETTRGQLDADRIVVAAGAWSGTLSGLRQIPVAPVRGQVLRIAGEGDGPRHIVSGSLYAAPAPDGVTTLIGATEEQVGFSPGHSVEGLLVLTAYVARSWPRLRARQIVAQWSGFRAGSADGRPLIGTLPGTGDQILVATGHGGQGLLTGGVTGRLVARLLDTGSCPELDQFSLARLEVTQDGR